MAELDSVQWVTRGVFNTGLLGAGYTALNGLGFSDDIKILKVYNGSGVGIDISYDGVTDHDFWPAGATIIFDFQTNHRDSSSYGSGRLYLRKGQIIYGKTSTVSTQLIMAGAR
jgi:hypothetical protein